MKTYAGIGSRETPADILQTMKAAACELTIQGWTLRSGAAEGADKAFEAGAYDGRFGPGSARQREKLPYPQVFLPWETFNAGQRVMMLGKYYVPEPQPEAFPIAERFHPNWDRCSKGARALHARNVHQILGPDVTSPVLSRFVICWTKGGEGGGGTGQALRIARHYDVPIFDLARDEDLQRVSNLWT